MKAIKRLLIQFKKGKEKDQMSFKQPLKNPATNSSFEVVAQVNDDTTGVSGTVFKDPVSGEFTIAFRGTEIGNEKNKCLNSRI